MIEPEERTNVLQMLNIMNKETTVFAGMRSARYWDSYNMDRRRPRRFLFEAYDEVQLGSFVTEGKHFVVKNQPLFNTTTGSIYSTDLLDAPDDLVMQHLSQYKVTKMHRVKKRLPNGNMETTPIINLTFDTPNLPSYVKIERAYLNMPVKRNLPTPMQCRKCWQYGHVKIRCSAEEICAVCSDRRHVSTRERPCTNDPHCDACQGAHTNFRRNCNQHKDEQEILATVLAEHIPFWQARKRIKSRSNFLPNARETQKRSRHDKQTERNPEQRQPTALNNSFSSLEEEEIGQPGSEIPNEKNKRRRVGNDETNQQTKIQKRKEQTEQGARTKESRLAEETEKRDIQPNEEEDAGDEGAQGRPDVQERKFKNTKKNEKAMTEPTQEVSLTHNPYQVLNDVEMSEIPWSDQMDMLDRRKEINRDVTSGGSEVQKPKTTPGRPITTIEGVIGERNATFFENINKG
ncbi:hypothetical protein SNEBB_002004 [Seison nebaliae]|nr:hypothetical protein SNEBB_002004 [Seison nebaliae]